MTIRQASILFLTGILLGVAIAGGCITASQASVPQQSQGIGPSTVPTPYFALDRFDVIALPDSLGLCRRVSGDGDHMTVQCVPVPHGSYLLVPNNTDTPRKAD